jgi:hypothetical protein
MRQAGRLHSLAKTRRRPAFSNAAKKRSSDDSQKERERDRLWNHRLQRGDRSAVSRFPQIVETVRGQAGHRDRLDACSRVAALAWRPRQGAFTKKMYMQMRNALAGIWPAIDDHTVTVG